MKVFLVIACIFNAIFARILGFMIGLVSEVPPIRICLTRLLAALPIRS